MTWIDGPIHDCTLRPLTKYADERGWLAEFFRQDELNTQYHPVMGYLSSTRPGVARGPHEHIAQTDLFVFFSGRFSLFLWDARLHSPTYGRRQVLVLGKANPAKVLVPPGVVHAYRNDGPDDALILNCPNALYAGPHRAHPVDEIRHEDLSNHSFIID